MWQVGVFTDGIEYDPLRALYLYQTAEIGLRISADKGMAYCEKRLQESIEGQEQARAALDCFVRYPELSYATVQRGLLRMMVAQGYCVDDHSGPGHVTPYRFTKEAWAKIEKETG